MKFTNLLLIVASAGSIVSGMALPSELTKRKPDTSACANTLYASTTIVGGSVDEGDNPDSMFCATEWINSHSFIKTLDVYWDDKSKAIRGIKMWYTNGKDFSIGGGWENKHQKFDFDAGEAITSGYLTGNGKGSRLGKIYFQTNKGREFTAGNSDAKAYDFGSIGSGIPVGIFGHAGSDIDNLQFIFLKPKIKRTTISNMVFKQDLKSVKPKTSDIRLDSVHYYVRPDVTSQNNTFSFTGSKEITISSKTEQHTLGSFGMHAEVEMDAAPLGIGAKATGGYEWRVEHGTMSSQSKEYKDARSWSFSSTLKPGEGSDMQAISTRGEGNFDYTTDVKVDFEDGNSVTYKEDGTLEQVAYTNAQVVRTQNNVEAVPNGYTPGSTKQS